MKTVLPSAASAWAARSCSPPVWVSCRLTKTMSASGHSTPATPAAVLHDTPQMGESLPRSIVMYWGAPPLQPTVGAVSEKTPVLKAHLTGPDVSIGRPLFERPTE